VPRCEVAHRIEREQPNKYPDPYAENVLRQRCRANDRACGKYQPEGPREDQRSAGAGDPVSGRQPPVVLHRPTPICGCAPRCSSGQCEMEEDDDREQTYGDDANLDLGHTVIMSERAAKGEPAVRISAGLHFWSEPAPATCESAR
jgi:hypothetical protein